MVGLDKWTTKRRGSRQTWHRSNSLADWKIWESMSSPLRYFVAFRTPDGWEIAAVCECLYQAVGLTNRVIQEKGKDQ